MSHPGSVSIMIPNGSLEKPTKELFRDAGLEIITEERSHFAHIESSLICKVLITRPQHIPERVAGGQYTLGICGLDCVMESGCDVQTVMELPYSKKTSQPVRVVLFTHENNDVNSISEISDHDVILSEYPNITNRTFVDHGVNARIKFSPGSTESLVPEPYKYGVCVTETGASLRSNRLKIIDTLMDSPTVMIASKESMSNSTYQTIEALRRLLSGVLTGRGYTMLTMNVPVFKLDPIIEILPSQHSPTISSLVDNSWCSVQCVVPKIITNDLMLRLMALGAEDIVETAVIRMVRVRD